MLSERKKNGEYVFRGENRFPGYPTWISRQFKFAVLENNFDKRLHFHSCRHSFASWLVKAGVSLYQVQKLLGHSSLRVTQMYAHLEPSNLHNAVNILDSKGAVEKQRAQSSGDNYGPFQESKL
jgi:site-specific recombinase XerD